MNQWSGRCCYNTDNSPNTCLYVSVLVHEGVGYWTDNEDHSKLLCRLTNCNEWDCRCGFNLDFLFAIAINTSSCVNSSHIWLFRYWTLPFHAYKNGVCLPLKSIILRKLAYLWREWCYVFLLVSKECDVTYCCWSLSRILSRIISLWRWCCHVCGVSLKSVWLFLQLKIFFYL